MNVSQRGILLGVLVVVAFVLLLDLLGSSGGGAGTGVDPRGPGALGPGTGPRVGAAALAASREDLPAFGPTDLAAGDKAGAAASPVRESEPAAQRTDELDQAIARQPQIVRPAPVRIAPERTRPPRSITRRSLDERVAGLLANKALNGATVAIAVLSASHGETVLVRSADAPMAVASNTKLVTTAAALELLGPEFQFETVVLKNGELGLDGVLHGDLIIQGGGDPDFLDRGRPAEDHLAPRLARAVRDAGVRRVTGRLILDDLIFDREHTAKGWGTSQLHKPYCAPVSGLTLYENCLSVRVDPADRAGAPARIELFPQTGIFALRGEVKSIASGKNLIDVAAPTSGRPIRPGKLTVRGTRPIGTGVYSAVLPVEDPLLFAGLLLQEELGRAGVEIEQGWAPAEHPIDSEEAGVSILALVESPLKGALVEMNKDSSNVIAEHLYKLCGAIQVGAGSFADGGRAMLQVLERLGVDSRDAQSADGSGLSRGNLYTARQLAGLASALFRGPHRELVLASLPEAGVDGTLRNRLKERAYRGRARAKTGYIAKVSSLTGLCQTDHGEVLAFSILVNGYRGLNAGIKPIQDDIVRLLIDLEPAAP